MNRPLNASSAADDDTLHENDGACPRCKRRDWKWKLICHECATDIIGRETAARIVAFLRRHSEDGRECSAEREMLAQQIERGEHLK